MDPTQIDHHASYHSPLHPLRKVIMMTESCGRAYSPPELLCEFLVDSYILEMEWELLWIACQRLAIRRLSYVRLWSSL